MRVSSPLPFFPQDFRRVFRIRHRPDPEEYDPAQWEADAELWMTTQYGDAALVRFTPAFHAFDT